MTILAELNHFIQFLHLRPLTATLCHWDSHRQFGQFCSRGCTWYTKGLCWISSTKDLCLRFSIAVKRYHCGDSYERKRLFRAGLQFRSLVHSHHDRKHGRSKIVVQQIWSPNKGPLPGPHMKPYSTVLRSQRLCGRSLNHLCRNADHIDRKPWPLMTSTNAPLSNTITLDLGFQYTNIWDTLKKITLWLWIWTRMAHFQCVSLML